MTFKDLAIGAEFEFDHSVLTTNCMSLAHGPWRKVSARKYVRVLGDTTVDLKHAHVVGSIAAAVRTDGTCGKYAERAYQPLGPCS